MNKIYILFFIILYFIDNKLALYGESLNNNSDSSQLSLISKNALNKLQNFIGSRNDEINKFRKLISNKSSCVVLIYTISDDKNFDKITCSHQTRAFYNSAIKPREKKSDYKYGITSGVMVSNDGIVVTTYTGTMNSDRYIVAIDSEKHKEDNAYGDIALSSSIYEAHVIKSFPGLNLVFLQVEKNKNEEFEYLNIANDTFFNGITGDNKYLIYDAIVIGKCKGDHFVKQSQPFNSRNRFNMQTAVIGAISYLKDKGIPTIVMYTPVTGDGSLPENHGGALIRSDGKLIGIPVWRDGLTLPYTFAIPSSTIKKGLTLTKSSYIEAKPFGLQVNNLDKNQQRMLLRIIRDKFKIIDEKKIEEFYNKQSSDQYMVANELAANNNLGVIVTSVTLNSPAEIANIKRGDILLQINDDYILDAETFKNIEKHSIDVACIAVTLLRGNELITLEIRR